VKFDLMDEWRRRFGAAREGTRAETNFLREKITLWAILPSKLCWRLIFFFFAIIFGELPNSKIYQIKNLKLLELL
jgi:hypothetical protein